jgi:hypothetical protein
MGRDKILRPKPGTLATDYDTAIRTLVDEVRNGRPVVPLVGAGISIESGVPPLSEVTRYLAKVKAYLRHKIYENRRPEHTDWKNNINTASQLTADLGKPAFKVQPHIFLRDFGWPDPHQLNSSLWHSLWTEPLPKGFSRALDQLVDHEILESLWRIDSTLAAEVYDRRKPDSPPKPPRKPVSPPKTPLRGAYWKILLSQLTRSSPDLIDTMFQRLTYNRAPSAAHRYFAFLTPVLRLRLFLTINFDSLIEDALREEGLRPTVYEVAEGLKLPDPKLIQEGLSVVKLHGGAYGLMAGERLDSPLDEETRSRFRAYLPENLVLLVMGIGGWDQRVLDMLQLTYERQGTVCWLHFEPDPPDSLGDRFSNGYSKEDTSPLPAWLATARVLDPGAFLREVFTNFKGTHPSSSRPHQVCDLRPVLYDKADGASDEKGVFEGWDGRLVVYEDQPADFSLGASLRLARFVAAKSSTHLPIWLDLETKFTVEDLLVEIIQQLRRYDPGLPPEILVLERFSDLTKTKLTATGEASPIDLPGKVEATKPASTKNSPDSFRKVVRRLYAALARGRYILGFSGLESFGRLPTSHHCEPQQSRLHQERQALAGLLQALIDGIQPKPLASTTAEDIDSLGLLDSILAFSFEPTTDDPALLAAVSYLRRNTKRAKGANDACVQGWPDPSQKEGDVQHRWVVWHEYPALAMVSAIRRRRSNVILSGLLPKYLLLSPDKGTVLRGDDVLKSWIKSHYLWRLEGGDYWMARKLRNSIYSKVRDAGGPGRPVAERLRALTFLACVHQDLAHYYHRDVYVGTHDVSSFLEEIYHRVASIRRLHALLSIAGSVVEPRERIWAQTLFQNHSDFESSSSEWELIDERGTLSATNVTENLLRSLRALREVLLQERASLRARVPSVTLQHWTAALKKDIGSLVSAGGDIDEGLLRDVADLIDLLEDIEVDVLQDRMMTDDILVLRILRLRKLLSEAGEIPSSWSLRFDRSIVSELRWLTAEGESLPGPDAAQLLWLCTEVESPKIRRETVVPQGRGISPAGVRRRVVHALIDVARALRHSTGAPAIEFQKAADSFADLIGHILEIGKRRPSQAFEHRYDAPASTGRTNLAVQYHGLRADLALWGQSPWSLRTEGSIERAKQRRVAAEANEHCEQALAILDSIYEHDRTVRSHFYSLQGRTLYLAHSADEEYRHAYRYLDLARAGLSDATPGEREALAVALLRQAECLMVHSGTSLIGKIFSIIGLDKGWKDEGSWGASDEDRRSNNEGEEVQWIALLSSEGFRKLSRERESSSPGKHRQARELLGLSLANWNPDLLWYLEAAVFTQPQHRRVFLHTLGAMRSQLSVAHDLLTRVEGLLEASGSKVEWWSLLFELQAQLAVERLLLLISGDQMLSYRVDLGDFERDPLPSAEAGVAFLAWFRSQLLKPQAPAVYELPSVALQVGRSLLSAKADLRPRFIHAFQDLLRDGVMAVRRGLDILLPDDAERQKAGRLENDVLLKPLLRSWSELMVTGATATEMSQGAGPADSRDDSKKEVKLRDVGPERWKQWRYLNWLSGLTTLPRCSDLENWFLDRLWNIDPHPPGLASRAQALARMDLCLAAPGESNPPGGGAVEVLLKHLMLVPRAAKKRTRKDA